MKIKSIAIAASTLIAAASFTTAYAAPDHGCGAGSCSKKSKNSADHVESGCSKKDMEVQASPSKDGTMKKSMKKKMPM